MGAWVLARAATGQLDNSKTPGAVGAGITTQYDAPVGEAEGVQAARDALARSAAAVTAAENATYTDTFTVGNDISGGQLVTAAQNRADAIKAAQEIAGDSAAKLAAIGANEPVEEITPLEQMNMASGSDLLGGVTFARMLERDKDMLVRKGQSDALSMYEAGESAEEQASYYDKASQASKGGDLFKTLLGVSQFALGAALTFGSGGTLTPFSGGLMFSGAGTAAGGIFG
jgi:hypothetical protein